MREVHCPASAEIKTGEVRLLIFRCFVFHQKHCSKFKPIPLSHSNIQYYSIPLYVYIYIYIPYIYIYPISNTYVAPFFFHRFFIPVVPLVDWIIPEEMVNVFRRIWPLGKASTWSSSPPAADSFSPAPHAERSKRRETRRETRRRRRKERRRHNFASARFTSQYICRDIIYIYIHNIYICVYVYVIKKDMWRAEYGNKVL